MNNADGVTEPITAGQGYAFTQTNSAPTPDNIYAINTSTQFVQTPGGYSIITDLGTPVATAPAGTSMGFGMPFTTGTVYIKVPFYPDPFLTVTAMGEDNRTPLGVGNITMVAGGINLQDTGFSIPQIVTVTLNVPEPSRVLALASGVGLIGLVAIARRRAAARVA